MVQDGGARVLEVEKGSIAEAAGIRDNDLISEAAGTQLKRLDDITGIVKRQAPGTWLPLKLKRGGDIIELIAKFPAVHK
jgi:S1-C subfamily serine protease